MVVIQSIIHFFMYYMQQHRNHVVRRNKVLVYINRNLKKREDIFLKILDPINVEASLQELLPKRRTR